MYNPGEYRKSVQISIGKEYNLCECLKIVEYGQVPGKVRIRVSTEKLSARVSREGTICVSTQKL